MSVLSASRVLADLVKQNKLTTRPRRKDLPGKTTVELFLEMLAGLSG
jgi:hypothetical protein